MFSYVRVGAQVTFSCERDVARYETQGGVHFMPQSAASLEMSVIIREAERVLMLYFNKLDACNTCKGEEFRYDSR